LAVGIVLKSLPLMSGEVQLQELLFGLQNPANEKLFFGRCATLFQTDDTKTWIDVYEPGIAQTIQAEASAVNDSSGSGPPRNDSPVHRVGDNIQYD
jgi:hypothetical protein